MNSYQEINTFINHVYGENRFSNDEFQTIFIMPIINLTLF